MAGDTSTEGLPTSGRSGTLTMLILLIIAVLWAAYEVPAVGRTGQTFGKRVMGIKVVALESGRAGRRRPLAAPLEHPRPAHPALVLLRPRPRAAALRRLLPVVDRPLHQALHDKRGR